MTIGDMARRTGLSVSAIRFYEARGLVTSARSHGGQRRYLRADIRRFSFIKIAQQLGLSIDEIGGALRALPKGRTPTARDWATISGSISKHLDAQIAALTLMRDRLDGCIGCGCLSLDHCALYNPDDRAARAGSGPRYLLGDTPIAPT